MTTKETQTRIYIVQDGSNKTWRIRATSYSYSRETDLLVSLRFEGVASAAANLTVREPFQVIPEDMLLSPLENDLVFPAMPADTGSRGLDPFTDALFSEAEKTPFAPQERWLVHAVLDCAKEQIHEQFHTSKSQQAEIDSKLDYLKRKVDELDKFNWKRLFITILVGVSVDLCFGTVIPSALLNIFKEVLLQLSNRLTKKRLS